MNCNICNIELNNDNWLLSRQKRHSYICKICENNKNKQRYTSKKSLYLENIKKSYLKIKLEVFSYYGNKCKICGVSDFEILSLDHIDGGGRKHREEVLGIDSGSGFYRWVLKNKPNNIRLLCFNCNCKRQSELVNKRQWDRFKVKADVYREYGSCVCGEGNIECLTIDHIDNSGADHRREIGSDIYSWLKVHGYPKDNFQTLCFNCNIKKYKRLGNFDIS